MELKRILARDTRSATEQAIRLYGEDVLIVSNHRVGQQTELVVAVDIPAEAAMANRDRLLVGRRGRRRVNRIGRARRRFLVRLR